ncbi:MAG: hypothetical protein F4W90_12440 [Gammaproteobacteria bacterium]|nr:hypothetical protein [Gammaproteobacteria bacterium]
MLRTLCAFAITAILVVGVAFEADARRFGGSFKFSSARSYKAPAFKSFSKRTTPRPKATTSRPNTQSAASRTSSRGFGGGTRASANASAARRASTSSRLASKPTNNFRSNRQQNAYKNYQSQQQAKFRGTSSSSNTAASSSPLYRKASQNSGRNRSDYWDRRDSFYGGWNAPNYVYMGAPRYGMFDGMFLGYMLGHAFTPHYSAFAYHHRSDPGMQAWMADMERQAAENAEVKVQLTALKAEMAKLEGTPIDPAYFPPGIDPDMVMAVDVVKALAPTFRLCTARVEGNYHRFGEILQQVSGDNVLIEIVNTAGSMQNLEYLEEDKCDGAYVQRNAFGIYAERNPSGGYDFERVATPAVEFAHMICNRDSDVDEVGDLPGKSLLIDAVGSGTEVTWADFVTMDDNYNTVETQTIGGSSALNRVATGEADCMMYVASLNTQLLQRANTLGDDVVLVPVNDWDFNNKEYGHGKLFKGHQDPSGQDVYVFLDIPDDQYPKIQDGIFFSDVETLSVPVDMVANLAWRDENAEAYEQLLGAVLDAQPVINTLTSEH